MQISINAKEAREKFSQLLNRAEQGEEVDITRRGKVVAKLVGVKPVQLKSEQAKCRAALRAELPSMDISASELTQLLREERV